MNKKQQLLTSLISEINKPQPKKAAIINGLSELETETKQDCSHCQHQNMRSKFPPSKRENESKKLKNDTKNPSCVKE